METLVAWAAGIERRDGPAALLLSRQNVAYPAVAARDVAAIRRGAYVLSDAPGGKPRAVIIATGSEVPLALEAQTALAAAGVAVRVVSMPSTTVFDRQAERYKAGVLVEVRACGRRGHRSGPFRRVGACRRALPALRVHRGQRRCHRAGGHCEREAEVTIKVAINGYGRIGRNILRAHYEGGGKHDIRIVAINDLGDPKTNAHLTKHDTAHGPFPGQVSVDGDAMVVNGDRIKVLANRNPAELPWGALGVDVVLECTGFFTTKEKAGAHLKGGAKKVIISAPGGKDVDATVVYGVNHGVLKATDTVISNASCTTNCLAPLVKPLHDRIGLVTGLMTTVHAYTNDQVLTDVYHEDLRRARAAAHNMIPTKTGAAAAVGLVLPELNGKLDGFAIRVPTINVSLVDLSFIAARDTTADEVNAIMQAAAASGPLAGVLGFNADPLVSSDFNHDARSSIFDATLTKVAGRLVKVSSWYDNEWGFSNRMLDTTVALMAAK
jgi:glyceraldehyde 3-phosphate dehydrogenase